MKPCGELAGRDMVVVLQPTAGRLGVFHLGHRFQRFFSRYECPYGALVYYVPVDKKVFYVVPYKNSLMDVSEWYRPVEVRDPEKVVSVGLWISTLLKTINACWTREQLFMPLSSRVPAFSEEFQKSLCEDVDVEPPTGVTCWASAPKELRRMVLVGSFDPVHPQDRWWPDYRRHLRTCCYARMTALHAPAMTLPRKREFRGSVTRECFVTSRDLSSCLQSVTQLFHLGIVSGLDLLSYLPLFSAVGICVIVSPEGVVLGYEKGFHMRVARGGNSATGFFMHLVGSFLMNSQYSCPMDKLSFWPHDDDFIIL